MTTIDDLTSDDNTRSEELKREFLSTLPWSEYHVFSKYYSIRSEDVRTMDLTDEILDWKQKRVLVERKCGKSLLEDYRVGRFWDSIFGTFLGTVAGYGLCSLLGVDASVDGMEQFNTFALYVSMIMIPATIGMGLGASLSPRFYVKKLREEIPNMSDG